MFKKDTKILVHDLNGQLLCTRDVITPIISVCMNNYNVVLIERLNFRIKYARYDHILCYVRDM